MKREVCATSLFETQVVVFGHRDSAKDRDNNLRARHRRGGRQNYGNGQTQRCSRPESASCSLPAFWMIRQ